MRKRILEAAGQRPDAEIVDFSGFYAANREQIFSDVIHTLQAAKPALAEKMADSILARMPGG